MVNLQILIIEERTYLDESQEILLSDITVFADCFVMYLTCFYNQNPWFCQVHEQVFFSDTKNQRN